jgi:outer membrane protein insertion porin family
VSIKRFILIGFFVMLAATGARAGVRLQDGTAVAIDEGARTSGAAARRREGVRDDAVASSASRRLTRDISQYEGRVVASVDVVIEEATGDNGAAAAEFRSLLRVAPGRRFSAVQVRESLQLLFDSERVANARVEAFDAGGAAGGDGRTQVGLRFIIRPQVFVAEVVLDVGVAPEGISEDELRARLNMLDPGKRLSEQSVRNNADLIQAYLRDRGFYRANVDFEQQLDATKTRATIVYRITTGARATVGTYNIQITGFDTSAIQPELTLRPGAPYMQSSLGEDIARIRQAIIAQGFLAPRLGEPRITLDSERNVIDVELSGAVGPKVSVEITGYELDEKKRRELLPILREGTIDQSAIEEGARRIRNRLQENGFFFAEVEARCTVNPPVVAATVAAPPAPANGSAATTTLPPQANGAADNGSDEDTCGNLNPEELSGRTTTITYDVAQGRRFKLADIRIEGTDKLTVADVADDLRTREANALGFIPLFGLGRGYTSSDALDQDRRTIEARMRDLGYRRARAEVRQGVSVEGENLIITFVVTEGKLTRVAGVETRGNQIYTAEKLREEACPTDLAPGELCTIIEGPFSRTAARNESDRIRAFYARNGYLDADVQLAIVDLPEKAGDEQVRLIYTVTEADKVFINRIFVNGNIVTNRDAIIDAIPLREGEVLRTDNIAESERILYGTDAFRQVIIRSETAGETASGFKRRDLIIDVEERKRYVMDYGGGFSTDSGPLGLFEIRNSNLFGKLRQGALRTRASNRQQLLRLEYFDPRFRRYGARAFAPLNLSAQYQRDSSVTRFFRSTIDRGNFGIVQRLNEEGQPIDINCPLIDPPTDTDIEICRPKGAPTINRFTVNLETQRDIELKLGTRGQVLTRSTLFLRYNYEDVRLFNIESLLIAPILRPDRAVRLSRFGATFARDSRDSSFDATRGDFLTFDYAIALKQLGGNLSFSKLQATYRRYYTIPKTRGTVLAAGIQLGLARLYSPTDRNDNGIIDDVDRTLPISERFFSGGSTSLRGFRSEEAGPRIVVAGGRFRNSNGELVDVDPFTVPIGGNALAVVNLEARIAAAKGFQVVPFYDGGNVFRSVKDIFRKQPETGVDPNLQAKWTHSVGLGIRFKTPFGPIAVDYAFMLNPPEFILNLQNPATPEIFRLKRSQIHFRFGQTF